MSAYKDGDIVQTDDAVCLVKLADGPGAMVYVVPVDAPADVYGNGQWMRTDRILSRLTENRIRAMIERRELAISRLRKGLGRFRL